MDRKKIHKTSINCNINSNHQAKSYVSFFTSEFILLLVLVVCICFIYMNSIKGPFIFDDIPNILDNPSVYYNVACIYAIQNKPEESVEWLKKAVEKGFSDWKHIKTDSDLDNIRGSIYYKEFVKDH